MFCSSTRGKVKLFLRSPSKTVRFYIVDRFMYAKNTKETHCRFSTPTAITLTCQRVLLHVRCLSYWIPKRHSTIHNSPPKYPVLRQMNLFHLSNSTSVISILILSSYLLPILPTDFLPSSFAANQSHLTLCFIQHNIC